jgi:hypothetical protein
VIQQLQNLQRSNAGPTRSLGIVSDGGAREDGGNITGEDGQEASRLGAFLSALTEVLFFRIERRSVSLAQSGFHSVQCDWAAGSMEYGSTEGAYVGRPRGDVE